MFDRSLGQEMAHTKRLTQIFSRKTKSNGTPHAIRAEKKLEKLAKGDWIEKKKKDPPFDQARVVVQYLREMIGTFIYMQDDEVASIFAKEKNRIGLIIDAIDKQLYKTPRQKNFRKRRYEGGHFCSMEGARTWCQMEQIHG
jgi:hypothetical protein